MSGTMMWGESTSQEARASHPGNWLVSTGKPTEAANISGHDNLLSLKLPIRRESSCKCSSSEGH
ncbi:hypothetical protein M5D96_010319, partial [Drosophila gunungcola]